MQYATTKHYRFVFMLLNFRFFERIQTLISTQHLTPEAANTLRELLFIPYNSHYILAAVSPILFILMIVKGLLLVFVSNQVAPKVSIIMSFLVSFEMHNACIEVCMYYCMHVREVGDSEGLTT